jgi:CBS domain containing-hemolysin-like protein
MKPLARQTRPRPSSSVFVGILRRLREFAGGEGEDTRDALEELIQEAEAEGDDTLSQEERELLRNVLAFGELRVDDVKVPRTDIDGVAIDTDLAGVVRAMRESGHSRLVVYRGTLDEVVGLVHVKDLLRYWGDGAEFRLADILRPVLVVPPSMRLVDLLIEMREQHQHVAVVVDEFGGTDGLVTLEDIVEEIVGDMPEEDEEPEPELLALGDGSFEADARLPVEELEEALGVTLLDPEEREEIDTVAGLIFHLLDRVPATGEVVDHPAGLRFVVLEADPRRILRVSIRRIPATAAAAEAHG